MNDNLINNQNYIKKINDLKTGLDFYINLIDKLSVVMDKEFELEKARGGNEDMTNNFMVCKKDHHICREELKSTQILLDRSLNYMQNWKSSGGDTLLNEQRVLLDSLFATINLDIFKEKSPARKSIKEFVRNHYLDKVVDNFFINYFKLVNQNKAGIYLFLETRKIMNFLLKEANLQLIPINIDKTGFNKFYHLPVDKSKSRYIYYKGRVADIVKTGYKFYNRNGIYRPSEIVVWR